MSHISFCNRDGFQFFYYCIISILCFFLQSCATTSYFNTPNDVRKVPATVYMENGDIKKGSITISLEDDYSGNNAITIVPENDTVSKRINFKDIKYYTIGNDTYVPKIIDLFLRGDYHYLFLKRLTDQNARLQFYELPQLRKSNDAGEETSYYFFELPYFSKYEVVDINSVKVIPDFDDKMSNYVSDCTELANKIKSKQPGYYYTFLSLRDAKLKVMERIVKEYKTVNKQSNTRLLTRI